jgi:hypothetical protein
MPLYLRAFRVPLQASLRLLHQSLLTTKFTKSTKSERDSWDFVFMRQKAALGTAPTTCVVSEGKATCPTPSFTRNSRHTVVSQ